jgi:tuberculosinol/isotuberculosinol synthase
VELERFQSLPVEEVARLVRADGPKVCVFPINGTRRWFMLEHPEEAASNFEEAYFRIAGRRHVELYKLFFDHGIETLLSPVIGPDILQRGEEYNRLVAPGLQWLTQSPDLLDFYETYDVRVRIYGDTRRHFENTPYVSVLKAFDELAQRTASHRRFRLFFGVCAHDPTETVAEIAVDYYQEHNHLPSKEHIVQVYYGEQVGSVDLFIGFDRPAAFDMPLVATGSEDLYFTVSPSLYLDDFTLRAILYDHMYARRVSEEYVELSSEDWGVLSMFYSLNRRSVLGLGRRHTSGSFWYPLPQVELPPCMIGDREGVRGVDVQSFQEAL